MVWQGCGMASKLPCHMHHVSLHIRCSSSTLQSMTPISFRLSFSPCYVRIIMPGSLAVLQPPAISPHACIRVHVLCSDRYARHWQVCVCLVVHPLPSSAGPPSYLPQGEQLRQLLVPARRGCEGWLPCCLSTLG